MSEPHLEPAPPNDYAEYIRAYFDFCRDVSPRIIGICGKWRFDDLIPGLSDFDARLLVADGTTLDEWRAMSAGMGELHERLVRVRPDWTRNLEHLPGISLMSSELTDDDFYYPEAPQWTFYHGPPTELARIEDYFLRKRWTARDEIFHLKRFAAFFGPYQRGIDPPINMGRWEGKYPLHSRLFHYFAPPIQAAVSLMNRRPCRGKREAFIAARSLFPEPALIEWVIDTIDRHYDDAKDYVDPRLAEIESALAAYLRGVLAAVASRVSVVEIRGGESPEGLRALVAPLSSEPAALFAEGALFGRLMKGRLMFFAAEMPGFDADFLVRNELGRIRGLFYDKPLKAFGQVAFGAALPAGEVLARLRGGLLTAEECDGFERFFRRADEAIPEGDHRRASREAAALYDPVMVVHDKLRRALSERLRASRRVVR